MTLRQKQSMYARLVADLILKAYELGYEVTLGDAYRDPRLHGAVGVKAGYGHAKSCHKLRLAIDLNLFKAMNDAGGTNTSYLWVEAAVRLMRPVAAALVIGTWAVNSLSGIADPAVDNFAAAVGFYLFGDRTLFYAKKG